MGKMIDQQFSQKPYSQPYSSVGQELLVNFYLELSISPTAKVPYYYVGIQGLHRLIAAEGLGPVRGMFSSSNGRCFAVWGRFLYEIFYNPVSDTCTRSKYANAPLKTSSGLVKFAENGTTMIFVDGQGAGTVAYGYTLNYASNVLGIITDRYFPGVQDNDPTHGPSHVACVDTYFVVNSQGTNDYYWSAPGYVPYGFDPTKPAVLSLWWGTQFGEKIGDTDNIIALAATVSNLWVIGGTSMEVHRSTGETRGQLFARVDGALVGFGCMAANTLVKFGNDVFWLGKDRDGTVGIFQCGNDYLPKRVSTRGVETRIQSPEYGDISKAYAWVYGIDGHVYYQIVFPSGTSIDGGTQTGASWCYDITTETWTRRNRWESSEGLEYRHQMEFRCAAFNKLICGDYRNDALYYLDSTRYLNDKPSGTEPEDIQGVFTTPSNYYQNKRVIFRRVLLNHQPGFTPRDGGTSESVIWIAWSDDSGVTWSQEEPGLAGETGEYQNRTMWFLLGSSRNRIFRCRMTHPFKRIITGITYDVEMTQV